MNLSAESVSPIFMAKFFSNSLLIFLEYDEKLQIYPLSKESLIVNNILIVGSSIAIEANLLGFQNQR
jgi:hypothetical protein